jgi:hypothetical protein
MTAEKIPNLPLPDHLPLPVTGAFSTFFYFFWPVAGNLSE